MRKNQTDHERKLWFCFLKDYPVKFKRQKPIGNYIVDFYCAKAKIALELDGSQHFLENGPEYDKKRTECIEEQGIEVLRFTNYEIDREFEAVCVKIDDEVRKRMAPSVSYADSSPASGGAKTKELD